MPFAIRTVKAQYENGHLRPLEPIEDREGLLYLVTVVDIAQRRRQRTRWRSLRGKYRNCLSTTDEFSRRKQIEKALER